MSVGWMQRRLCELRSSYIASSASIQQMFHMCYVFHLFFPFTRYSITISHYLLIRNISLRSATTQRTYVKTTLLRLSKLNQTIYWFMCNVLHETGYWEYAERDTTCILSKAFLDTPVRLWKCHFTCTGTQTSGIFWRSIVRSHNELN